MSAAGTHDYRRLMARSLSEIQRLKGELARFKDGRGEPIALVGAACRLPGAPNLKAFWRLLEDGVDAIGEIPPDRWNVDAYYDPDPSRLGKIYAREGGFLDQVDQFDPLFFGVSPREAETMDPQHRLLMEVSWEALEHAGIPADSLRGSRTGVYVGMMSQDYSRLNADPGQIDVHTGTNGLNSIAAARLAYSYDLAGPALCIDTACSSSLVAAHLACRALRAGDCDLALVGGVNVILSPYMMSLVCGAGVLAPDGRCKTFDAAADGFARGEGCVVVAMKRLSDAQADGDDILAVIRGSAVNQDGRSAGITVPSQLAQEAVIREALKDGGLVPGDVGYVEAHGTGTPLGDPIEIAALGEVYGPGRSASDPLIVGSVKTNFGHLEAASGLAGLLKAALAANRGEIPRQLHFATPNPHANWADWPIRVADAHLPWPAPERVAGVSSFGIAGTNAHLVVQSPPRRAPKEPAAPGPHLLLVSAKTAKGLTRRLEELSARLTGPDAPALADAALTLALGRQHFAHRCAIVADGLEHAASLATGTETEDLLRGVVQRGAGVDADAVSAALAATANGDRRQALRELARLYVEGAAPLWSEVFDRARAGLADLPTYPFSRERYWMSPSEGVAAPAEGRLHPLLDANVSDLAGLRFVSRLRPDNPVMRDHKVRGRPILPGVAYLEMARAAVAEATGRPAVTLRNIAWLRPLEGEEPVEAQVLLKPMAEGRIAFEIVTGDEVLHCQGLAVLDAAVGDDIHDLAALRMSLTDAPLAEEDCYRRFQDLGLDYGPHYRALRQVWAGEGRALARLEAPQAGDVGRYWLHPGLMDGALQASLALRLEGGGLGLPFAMGEVEIRRPCRAAMWAVVVHRGPETPGGPEKVDVDLCDDDGRVCVRLREGSTRPLAPAAQPLTLSTPVWERVTPRFDAGLPKGRTVLVGGTAGQRAGLSVRIPGAEALDGEGGALEGDPIAHLVWIAPTVGLQTPDGAAVLSLFRLAKTLLARGHGARAMTWTVLTRQAQAAAPGDQVAPDQAAIHGFLGSIAKEYPNWAIRLADLPAGDETPWEAVLALEADPDGAAWVLRDGLWRRRALARAHVAVQEPAPWQTGGADLVLGGAGGIGAAWSEHLIRTRGAQVIWLGRRPLDAAIQGKIDHLSQFGPAPDYIRVDAADRRALAAARAAILSRHGAVSSVTHSALVLADAGLARMDEVEFRAAFDAKAATSVALAEVFGNDPLEFFLMFSSMQSYACAAGQSNYAAGCAFADAFADGLRRRAAFPVKVVNWGYWGGVGAVASEAYRARALQAGVGSIEPAEGMAALVQLLHGPLDQIAAEKATSPAPGAGVVRVLPAKGPSLLAGLAGRIAARSPEPVA